MRIFLNTGKIFWLTYARFFDINCIGSSVMQRLRPLRPSFGVRLPSPGTIFFAQNL